MLRAKSSKEVASTVSMQNVKCKWEISVQIAVFSILNHLFLGGLPPKAPFPNCGFDLTADELPCEEFGPCGD
jgi:hypothetical protein